MRGSRSRGPPLNGLRVVLRPRVCTHDKNTTLIKTKTGLGVFMLGAGTCCVEGKGLVRRQGQPKLRN